MGSRAAVVNRPFHEGGIDYRDLYWVPFQSRGGGWALEIDFDR